MSVTRQRLWAAQVGRFNKNMPILASLAPTKDAFLENIKRAHLQACTWKHALNADPPNMDPCEFGWRRNQVMMTLVPILVPPTLATIQLNAGSLLGLTGLLV